MKFISALIAVFMINSINLANANTENEQQLLRFAKSVGIYEQIEEQKIALQAQSAQTAQQITQQINSEYPNLPEKFKQDSEEEMKVFLSNVAGSINTDSAVNAYLGLISKKLSPGEIVELTKFYESELGRKFTKSNTEVMGEWSQIIMKDLENTLVMHMKNFSNNLNAKASQYQKQ